MSTQPSQSKFSDWFRGSALGAILSSLAAVFVALFVGFLIIFISGDDPIEAYKALFTGAFGDRRGIGETLVLATPLLLAGLAFAIPFRAGMFNIGAEGQLVMGGLAAALVGAVDLGLPIYIHLPLALLAAAVAGGLWGAVPGALKAWSGAHEVITTIMLNYIAFRVIAYTVNETDSWLPVNPMLQATDPVEKSAKLPIILHGTRLHAGFIVALVAAVALWYLLFRTTFGYRIRTVGSVAAPRNTQASPGNEPSLSRCLPADSWLVLAELPTTLVCRAAPITSRLAMDLPRLRLVWLVEIIRLVSSSRHCSSARCDLERLRCKTPPARQRNWCRFCKDW